MQRGFSGHRAMGPRQGAIERCPPAKAIKEEVLEREPSAEAECPPASPGQRGQESAPEQHAPTYTIPPWRRVQPTKARQAQGVAPRGPPRTQPPAAQMGRSVKTEASGGRAKSPEGEGAPRAQVLGARVRVAPPRQRSRDRPAKFGRQDGCPRSSTGKPAALPAIENGVKEGYGSAEGPVENPPTTKIKQEKDASPARSPDWGGRPAATAFGGDLLAKPGDERSASTTSSPSNSSQSRGPIKRRPAGPRRGRQEDKRQPSPPRQRRRGFRGGKSNKRHRD